MINNNIYIDKFEIKGKGIIGYLSNISKLRKLVKEKNYDIIHSHYSLSALLVIISFLNKPIVVSKVRGLKEIINKDQSGEVFDKTPENLAKAILNCIDEKRNQLYISNIIKAKNYYSWSTFVEKIKTI